MYDELGRALGLKKAEIEVFSALVGRGAQPATRVAGWCHRSRNTVRGILDKLVHDGYVIKSRRANSHLYAIESAQGIATVLQMKLELVRGELMERLASVRRYSEVLDARTTARRPRISFYDGLDGVVKVYEDTLSSKEDLRSWGSFDANQDAIPAYFRSYYKRRAKQGIRIRSIHPDTAFARMRVRSNKRELRECVLVDQALFDIEPEIQVYDDKINIVSWKEQLGVIIESAEIARAMKQIFDLCYRGVRSAGRRKARPA